LYKNNILKNISNSSNNVIVITNDYVSNYYVNISANMSLNISRRYRNLSLIFTRFRRDPV